MAMEGFVHIEGKKERGSSRGQSPLEKCRVVWGGAAPTNVRRVWGA